LFEIEEIKSKNEKFTMKAADNTVFEEIKKSMCHHIGQSIVPLIHTTQEKQKSQRKINIINVNIKAYALV